MFDLAANDAALDFLRKLQLPVVVDSEESGHQEIGSGTPQHRLVLDPVDGSDNWARRLFLEDGKLRHFVVADERREII